MLSLLYIYSQHIEGENCFAKLIRVYRDETVITRKLSDHLINEEIEMEIFDSEEPLKGALLSCALIWAK